MALSLAAAKDKTNIIANNGQPFGCPALQYASEPPIWKKKTHKNKNGESHFYGFMFEAQVNSVENGFIFTVNAIVFGMNWMRMGSTGAINMIGADIVTHGAVSGFVCSAMAMPPMDALGQVRKGNCRLKVKRCGVYTNTPTQTAARMRPQNDWNLCVSTTWAENWLFVLLNHVWIFQLCSRYARVFYLRWLWLYRTRCLREKITCNSRSYLWYFVCNVISILLFFSCSIKKIWGIKKVVDNY